MPDDVAIIDNLPMKPQNSGMDLIDTLRAGRAFGHSRWGADRSVLVEYVSAHPNVPLSLSHARGGVVGDVLAALHSASGFTVEREFYVNDAQGSRPLRVFANAVFERYRGGQGSLESSRDEPEYGSAGFLNAVAERVYAAEGDRFADKADDDEAPPDFTAAALRASQEQHAELLESFGIRFDRWARESELNANGGLADTVAALRAAGETEIRGGALWLRSTRFGDEADRMLLRADGTATYLAGDLAYHRAKFDRSFDHLIDVWNADHATYVARTRAGLQALGFDAGRLEVLLVQAVRALRDGTAVQGGANGAGGVGLADLIAEIGADAARFSLALTPVSAPLDLDIDAVRASTSPFNRVRDAMEAASRFDVPDITGAHIDSTLLTDPGERALLERVSALPEVVERATREIAVHLLPAYAVDVARALLALPDDPQAPTALKQTRAGLRRAAAIALENALILIGISPDAVSTARTD